MLRHKQAEELKVGIDINIVLSRASRRQSYDYVEKRQRFQILDMVNKVSFILELYPRTKDSR